MGLISYIVQWRTSSGGDVSQCMTFLFTAKFVLFFWLVLGVLHSLPMRSAGGLWGLRVSF